MDPKEDLCSASSSLKKPYGLGRKLQKAEAKLKQAQKKRATEEIEWEKRTTSERH